MAALTVPEETGGWWHAYVCPAHGVELDHGDLLDAAFPADGAACRHGCRLDTDAVRGARTVLVHQEIARRLRHLAAGTPAERREAVAVLHQYAGLYAGLPGAHAGGADWMLRGRLFHQALTEAIWAVNIAHAVRTLAAHHDTGPGLGALVPFLDSLREAAGAARKELLRKGEERSNYTAWLAAAEISCHAAAEAVSGAAPDPVGLAGEYGLDSHMRVSVQGDGWEWEASTYYHLFVLHAYLLALRGARPERLPREMASVLGAMVSALAGVAAPDGTLPALHDGPYRREAQSAEIAEVAALAGRLFADTPLKSVAQAAGRDSTAPLPADLEEWFAGPPLPAPPPRRHFPDAGYAVFRTEGVHAVLDAGPHGGAHGHQDKLSLYLYADDGTTWQPDPGQVPYAHRSLRRYYAGTAAHPAFRVDDTEQRPCDAVLDGDAGRCDQAYDGVTATRRVVEDRRYLLDVLVLEAAAEHRLTAQLRPATALEVVAQGADRARTVWGEDGGAVLNGWHAAHPPAEFTVVPHPGPADDPARVRQGVDWSLTGRRAVFVSVYQSAEAASPVRRVSLSEHTVHIDLADGTVATHPIGA
ncbi:heparinase II/III family protein [Streptomyces verrucosisporus]|uniref:heparinase II/III domain-containing protein n=1 Tax=Streptomyces verrucosisporus TaxID=1695161 RepID=UPI0019CFE4E7|nr:heparinase II/III family protein [Streptomyces verrucosisporus]MBN3928264.1 heparinase II/III family protein [Streptomyces verrucosisporus]